MQMSFVDLVNAANNQHAAFSRIRSNASLNSSVGLLSYCPCAELLRDFKRRIEITGTRVLWIIHGQQSSLEISKCIFLPDVLIRSCHFTQLVSAKCSPSGFFVRMKMEPLKRSPFAISSYHNPIFSL